VRTNRSLIIAPPYNSINSAADVTYLPTGGVANAINNRNLIVGISAASSATPAFAFLYDGVDVTNPGTLAGGSSSGAYDINELDDVVGYSQTGSGNHAFIWNAVAGMRDLNDLVTDPAWVLVSATAINDAGDIAVLTITDDVGLSATASVDITVRKAKGKR
jgi:probable HAF family extracellular repeat protein